MERVKVAQIGCGYWGQNLIRNFWAVDEAEVVVACDPNPRALKGIEKQYPTVRRETSFEAVLADPGVQAVILATPVSTHFQFAKQALEAGKQVLIEKPMTTTAAEAVALIELAERKGLTLMVDHTFLYTSAVRRMKALVQSGELGDLLYYDSVRINLGLVQSDTNVVWDLAPHDFSIMDYLCGGEPSSVVASGAAHLNCPHANIAYVTVKFNSESNFIAHFHVNWLAPVKVRRTLIGGSKRMIVYDDMETTEKVKIYDKGITLTQDPEQRTRLLTGYRVGDVLAPYLDTGEALRLMAREFVTSIAERRAPLTDGYAGYRVVRLLEAAQRSLDEKREIPLSHADVGLSAAHAASV
jgi:predicted dehydrogenase